MIHTLSGSTHKADTKTLQAKRQAYIRKMNQDGNPEVEEDEFVGFLLACLSEEIQSKGTKELPTGLRKIIDLKRKELQ